MTATGGGTNQLINFNFPQPYYQTVVYGPVFPPGGGGVSYGAWLGMRSLGMSNAQCTLVTDTGASGEVSEGVRVQVARTLRELGAIP
jgi:hypothetical protein